MSIDRERVITSISIAFVLEWGVLGEPVHHHGTLPLARGDEVAVVRHVADLGLGDGLV